MKRFVQGVDRGQVALFPESLEDYITVENPVRVVETFVDALDLGELGFKGIDPCTTAPPPIIRLYCSSSISTATCTVFSRVAGWSENVDVTLS